MDGDKYFFLRVHMHSIYETTILVNHCILRILKISSTSDWSLKLGMHGSIALHQKIPISIATWSFFFSHKVDYND